MSSNQGQLPQQGSSTYDLHRKGFEGMPNNAVSRKSGTTSYSLQEQRDWTTGAPSSGTPTQGLSRASTLSATAQEFQPGSTATSQKIPTVYLYEYERHPAGSVTVRRSS